MLNLSKNYGATAEQILRHYYGATPPILISFSVSQQSGVRYQAGWAPKSGNRTLEVLTSVPINSRDKP